MEADEPLAKKWINHEIGADLSMWSIGELQERMTLLKEEIARLEAVVGQKSSTRQAADAFFKS